MTVFKLGDIVTRIPLFMDSFWINECRINHVDPNGKFVVSSASELSIHLDGPLGGWSPRKFQLHQEVIDLDIDDDECI